MDNPLLKQGSLPTFSLITPDCITPAISEIITNNKAELARILKQKDGFSWDTLMQPLEEMGDKLAKAWSPVAHMHATVETEALRAAYNACLPLLTEYSTTMMQNTDFYTAVKAIVDSSQFKQLNPAQQKILENDLRDFRLAGVNLNAQDKKRFADLQKQLSQLTTQFSENLLDATHGWSLLIQDKTEIAGLPPQALALAEQAAKAKGQKGWLLTLDAPCYIAAMRYINNRELRKTLHNAYITRASDLGPNAGKWDNSQIMQDILKARHAIATLLGFANYAEYSLATKMAATPKRVLEFLTDLVHKSKAAAQTEMQELQSFAHSMDASIQDLQAWDIAYFSEKLRQQKYDISQEELKPYFPCQQVLDGMFSVINKLYNISIQERKNVDTWHTQVQYFEIHDQNNQFIGGFYTDLYARAHKRDGAWMDECRIRRKLADGSIQYPVAYLTCNFSQPLGNQPALLSQDEVETLFHEFGHCLHHLLTKVDYAGVSGINGVPWDAVEFPSQMMEHWCWDKETIALISKHVDTGECLPHTLFTKMLASKNFQSGMQMVRQLEFSLFDFRIHLEYDPEKGGRIQEILDEVRSQVSVVPLSPFNRFQHSFSHIFSGAYAAGYYSYKWAEVLSSDAFSKFEEQGVFDRVTGQSYLENILQVGGVRDPMQSFVAFRGREPQIDALLRHSGLTPA